MTPCSARLATAAPEPDPRSIVPASDLPQRGVQSLLTRRQNLPPDPLGRGHRAQRFAGPTNAGHNQRADPLPRSITVDFPTVLLRDLLQLSSHVELDDDALGAPLVSLVEGLQAAVPSYRGLHLTIIDTGHPVSLTAFLPLDDGDSLKTSLRVGFAALGPGFDGKSCVVFYAATPGAFVDLAADFGYALDTPIVTPSSPARSTDNTDGDGQRPHGRRNGDSQHHPARRDGHHLIVLDADLPPPTTRSGLIGLDELSTVNRAVGILIDQGHHPNQAHATLRRNAAEAGVEPHIYAARLVRR
jgi:hypothetical protein